MVPKNRLNLGEVEAVDVPTMYALSDKEYGEFARDDGVVTVDRHGVLRCAVCACPQATTLEQVDLLIARLQRLRDKMAPRLSNAIISVDGAEHPAA